MQVKTLFGLILAAVVAGEAPYSSSGWKPSGGLLVVPPKQQPLNQYGPPAAAVPETRSAPQPENENISELERLKQQEGSDSGVYHVLLADGRLQKVEYATAPLKKEEKKEKEQNTKQDQPQYSQPQYSQSQQYNQFQQYNQPQQYNQQPEDPAKVWAINFGQNSAQQGFAQERSQGYNNFQEPQQFAGNAPLQAAVQQEQVGDWPVRYFEIFTRGPVGQDSRSQIGQYREEQAEAVGATSRQFQQQQQQQQRPVVMVMPQPSNYVASIQYTDVEPINPPVYAYSKGSPLVRIVRKSPLFK